MYHEAFTVRGILEPALRSLGITNVDVAIHEVVDDFNMVLDVEFPQRTLAQILRDGSYAIALFDRETRDRQVRAIQPDQRDVGAVERGHKRQLLSSGLGSQHLSG